MKYLLLLLPAMPGGESSSPIAKQLFSGKDLRKFDFEPMRGPRPAEGWFGIQNHSNNDIVYFKEISVSYAR